MRIPSCPAHPHLGRVGDGWTIKRSAQPVPFRPRDLHIHARPAIFFFQWPPPPPSFGCRTSSATRHQIKIPKRHWEIDDTALSKQATTYGVGWPTTTLLTERRRRRRQKLSMFTAKGAEVLIIHGASTIGISFFPAIRFSYFSFFLFGLVKRKRGWWGSWEERRECRPTPNGLETPADILPCPSFWS